MDTKGELRMDEWAAANDAIAQPSPASRPRVYLLFVQMPIETNTAPAISIDVPPMTVASRDVKPLAVSLPRFKQFKQAGTNAVMVTVSGQCRSLDKAVHDCSASLVESTGTGENYAALAPAVESRNATLAAVQTSINRQSAA